MLIKLVFFPFFLLIPRKSIDLQRMEGWSEPLCVNRYLLSTTESEFIDPKLPNVLQYNVLNVQSQVKVFGDSHFGKNEFIINTYQSTSDGMYLIFAIVILESVEVCKLHAETNSKYDGIDFLCYQCLDFLSKKKPFSYYFTQDLKHPNFSILNLVL